PRNDWRLSTTTSTTQATGPRGPNGSGCSPNWPPPTDSPSGSAPFRTTRSGRGWPSAGRSAAPSPSSHNGTLISVIICTAASRPEDAARTDPADITRASASSDNGRDGHAICSVMWDGLGAGGGPPLQSGVPVHIVSTDPSR